MIKKRRIAQLTWREYLPMALVIALWGVIVAAIGHADAARLLAAVTLIRAIQMLTRLATSLAVRRRMLAPRTIRRQARRVAVNLQLATLLLGLLLVAAIVEGLKVAGHQEVAAFLPFVALGMPARYVRLADARTVSPYFRLALGASGLATVLVGWALGWHAAAMGFAFGAREWVAYAVLRWWPRTPYKPKVPMENPLHFAEIARNSAIMGRRLLTYRVTKTILTVFGPFGNAAARTGRELQWIRKIEPYVPHHFGGFVAFSLGLFGAAAVVLWHSTEPAAALLASGLCQMGGAAANVVLLWHWLPPKGSEVLPIDDDDDE
ncbi:hypothetical protein [Sphingomonas edaphi]|uniref:Uncharacterized protein n=1 Tax=Sphingomonas edaphi TaxID=2315689 RepID=A0A418Q096_9SPHN|nr:hypothetical protein [Sphingomonas edaphi]RIX29282.1 hypothetical protein D3M59_08265 [Sphingomonas edaphi]